MSPNPVFAVLIGVSDYKQYDPSGGADLPGARNDAARWEGYCTGRLQLPAEQIHRCTSQASTTRAHILEELKWLGGQLALHPGSSGLVTFSGHGLTLEAPGEPGAVQGLTEAVAPSDIGPDLEAGITLGHAEIVIYDAAVAALTEATGEALTEAHHAQVEAALTNVTFVIDACYTRAPDSAARALTSRPAPSRQPTRVARLLMGGHIWEECSEITLGDKAHGAFTSALITMLDMWTVGSDDGSAVSYSRASYGDLIFRTRELLRVLGVNDQTPTLLGSQDKLALVPFLRPGKAVDPDWTRSHPDMPRTREELSGGSGNGFRSVLLEGYLNSTKKWSVVGRAIVGSKSMSTVSEGTFQFEAGATTWAFSGQLNANGYDNYRLTVKSYSTFDSSVIQAWMGLSNKYAPESGTGWKQNATVSASSGQHKTQVWTIDHNGVKKGFQLVWDMNTGKVLSVVTVTSNKSQSGLLDLPLVSQKVMSSQDMSSQLVGVIDNLTPLN